MLVVTVCPHQVTEERQVTRDLQDSEETRVGMGSLAQLGRKEIWEVSLGDLKCLGLHWINVLVLLCSSKALSVSFTFLFTN